MEVLRAEVGQLEEKLTSSKAKELESAVAYVAKESELEEALAAKELVLEEALAAKDKELAAVKGIESDLRVEIEEQNKVNTECSSELKKALADKEATQTAIEAKEEELTTLKLELSNFDIKGKQESELANLTLKSKIESLETEIESTETKWAEEREKLNIARSELLENITMMAEASN